MTITQLPPQRKPQKQRSFHVFQIPISAILADQSRYEVPDIQRGGNIWPELWNRVLVETIFEGHPIEPLHFHKKVYENGLVRYQVVNGQQRLGAIKGFYANQFRTLTESEAKSGDVGGEIPIEPGRLFQDLTVAAQNTFLNFELTVQCIEGVSDHDLEVIFRRSNRYAAKMTAAENLASYHSRAIDYARMVSHHSLWSEIYTGGNKRRQEILGTLFPLMLERSGEIYTSLAQAKVNSNATGSLDEDYGEELYERVLGRLDMVTHLFYKSTFRIVQNIIPLYQIVLLLERENDHPLNYERGCLTPWFMNLMHHKLGHGYGDRFRKMVNIKRQKEFWDDHYKQVRANLDRNRVAPYVLTSITG